MAYKSPFYGLAQQCLKGAVAASLLAFLFALPLYSKQALWFELFAYLTLTLGRLPLYALLCIFSFCLDIVLAMPLGSHYCSLLALTVASGVSKRWQKHNQFIVNWLTFGVGLLLIYLIKGYFHFMDGDLNQVLHYGTTFFAYPPFYLLVFYTYCALMKKTG